MKLFGQGFVVDQHQARQLGLGFAEGAEAFIRPYITAREITQTSASRFAMDFLGLEPAEIAEKFPDAYQWPLDHVKPERDHNNRMSYRNHWWLFGEPRKTFRNALKLLTRQIVTPETAKHRFFQFLPNAASLRSAATKKDFALAACSRAEMIFAAQGGG